mmetsp:Transcript_9635/g.11388  ORF Transcript_9635/g.11388 Transcript_9635/m.11388 type:complete len:151 (+) Transcript_9635:24-476(+)
MPPFTAVSERVARVIAFVREPKDYGADPAEHFRDTMFMKNLHALAWNHQHSVVFMWVDIDTDEDNIALSLGFDTLDPAFFPCMALVMGNSIFIAPKNVTTTYYNMGKFIEGGYKQDALTVWPVQRRLGSLGYSLKRTYRGITSALISIFG